MIIENYGWKLDTENAEKALEELCEALGEEDANAAIIRALSKDELTACIVYICRQYNLKLKSLEE